MRGSKIQWCDDTENPVMGCDGCELWNPKPEPPEKRCYAGILQETRWRAREGFARQFERVQLFRGRMARTARAPSLLDAARPEKPWFDGRPRHIFVSDMGDVLSKLIGFEALNQR